MDDLSDDELRECIRTMCLEELDAYGACSDTALESEDPCADSAENSCILPD